MVTNEAGNKTIQTIANLDRAIHEPARLVILAALSAVDCADFLFLLHQTRLTHENLYLPYRPCPSG